MTFGTSNKIHVRHFSDVRPMSERSCRQKAEKLPAINSRSKLNIPATETILHDATQLQGLSVHMPFFLFTSFLFEQLQ